MAAKRVTKESKARSLAKAVSHRILIVTLDSVAIYFFTRRLDTTAAFVVLSNVYSALAYYGHERLWNTIKWGRH